MTAASSSRRVWPLGLAAAPVFLLCLYLGIFFYYRIEDRVVLDSRAADLGLRWLRTVLEGRSIGRYTGPDPALDGVGPLFVTLYLDGDPLWQSRQDRGRLAERLERVATLLRADRRASTLSADERKRARLKLDLSVSQGPILAKVPLFFAQSLVPGLDGLGLSLGDDHIAYLLPDELFRRELLAGYQPFFFMHEFRTGLDLQAAVDQLAAQMDVTIETWRTRPRRYFRFRVQSFVEPVGKAGALPVRRLRVPMPQVGKAEARLSLTRSADYVLRQMKPDGKFEYIYYPLADSHSADGDYSLPRHAGTTWFLALAFRILKRTDLRAAVDQAIRYLVAHAVPPSCQKTPYACVGSEESADLGSAALAVVAIVEYQQSTADTRYLPLARRLGRFILDMQKPNGDFCHQFQPVTSERGCKDILLYYSGEAALALAKLLQATGDRESYLRPLERALDFLTIENYDFFLGQYFIGEDHWTCIAAEAAHPALDKDIYARFCYEFAALNRRAQIRPDDGLMGDLAGAFNISQLFMPHNTPVGSRSESNIATYLLSLKRGEPQPEILETIKSSMRFLVDQQIRPESAYLYPSPDRALGGLLQTPIRASIRIDYVQHAAAALARALPLLD